MKRGWFCIWRKIEDCVSWSRGGEYRGLMITILQKTNWKTGFFMGREIKPGQFATSMDTLGKELKISRLKCQRLVAKLSEDCFVSVENVNNRFSLITVTNWDSYQEQKELLEQPVNNRRTTGEQPVNTIKQGNKETKKQKSFPPAPGAIPVCHKASRERIIKYLNAKLGTGYQPNSVKASTFINARLNEGHKAEDFKIVIDSKITEWGNDPERKQYLRPETLFGTKFEGYLQATKMNIKPDEPKTKSLTMEEIERLNS